MNDNDDDTPPAAAQSLDESEAKVSAPEDYGFGKGDITVVCGARSVLCDRNCLLRCPVLKAALEKDAEAKDVIFPAEYFRIVHPQANGCKQCDKESDVLVLFLTYLHLPGTIKNLNYFTTDPAIKAVTGQLLFICHYYCMDGAVKLIELSRTYLYGPHEPFRPSCVMRQIYWFNKLDKRYRSACYSSSWLNELYERLGSFNSDECTVASMVLFEIDVARVYQRRYQNRLAEIRVKYRDLKQNYKRAFDRLQDDDRCTQGTKSYHIKRHDDDDSDVESEDSDSLPDPDLCVFKVTETL